MEYSESLTGPKEFVLCFDGTGNKFHGDDSDSNVLKIFRMLERSDCNQYHYYQPGIGTYVTSGSLSSDGKVQKMKSAYLKAKDSAIGSTFADHVMGGYKFLMRYYSPGDQIYFFGFSRGAYVARFLAEMLDYVGLLEMGNEELVRFAWKTFAKWQQRRSNTKDYEAEKAEQWKYMRAFRETFSRPVTQIQFLGLFDTVNSVPRFENAWMQRSRFPYTAKTSARVIRHAVGIDERRAKFRQDLISEVKPGSGVHHKSRLRQHLERHHLHVPHHHARHAAGPDAAQQQTVNFEYSVYRPTRRPRHRGMRDNHRQKHPAPESRATSRDSGAATDASTQAPHSHDAASALDDDDEGDRPQDLEEVWFPGCHADIGGGWKLDDGESVALSHAPLVWMVQEAQRAGLRFNQFQLESFNCLPDESVSPIVSPTEANVNASGSGSEDSNQSRFHQALQRSSTDGRMHDCLQMGQGLPPMSVLSWKMMEWLPFRRMDLQNDGSWKPIRWPLPRGEVRDIPREAQIHVSALRRMEANPDYRPGNLIIGGGGRGVRRASEEHGMGQWNVHKHAGCPVGETYIRRDAGNPAVSAH